MESEEKTQKLSYFLLGFLICCILFGSLYFLFFQPSSICTNYLTPLFSPNSESEIISLIRGAEKSIDIEMYVFSNSRLRDELSYAAERGISVRVILESRLDGGQNEKMTDFLLSHGVFVRWASLSYKLTHSKFMIIDGKKVLVGSINFSDSATTKNREAAVIFEGPKVAEFVSVFEDDWEEGNEATAS
jgi:phosphatidylserine/phosphatidylglycerophosphate/cardiolipin synthase-like enzyme